MNQCVSPWNHTTLYTCVWHRRRPNIFFVNNFQESSNKCFIVTGRQWHRPWHLSWPLKLLLRHRVWVRGRPGGCRSTVCCLSPGNILWWVPNSSSVHQVQHWLLQSRFCQESLYQVPHHPGCWKYHRNHWSNICWRLQEEMFCWTILRCYHRSLQKLWIWKVPTWGGQILLWDLWSWTDNKNQEGHLRVWMPTRLSGRIPT